MGSNPPQGSGGGTQTDAEIKTAYEANADTNEFSDAEQTKLAAIEASATADQTGAEIKTAYEAEANAYTDTKNTKLAGIETAATADQTNAEIETAYNAQVAAMSQATAEAGTSTTIERVTAQRIKQAIDALGGGGGTGQTFARVVKKADEAIQFSTTLHDDDELVVALSANKTYFGMIVVYINSGTTPNFKHAFSIPALAGGEWMADLGLWREAAQNLANITIAINHLTDGGNQSMANYFRIVMGATAGNLQYQWAQQTSNGSDTKVLEGSTLIIWEELA